MVGEFLVRDTRLPGHFWADNEVLDVFGVKLGAHAFAVYMVLCRFAINHTGAVRISSRKIAKLLGISPQGALNAIDRLIRLGLARQFGHRDNAKPGVYYLANVKALLNREYAPKKTDGGLPPNGGVNPVGTSGVVNPIDASFQRLDSKGHPVDRLSSEWTRNKEDKTSSKLETSKTLDPFCSKCNNTGSYPHKGHPGMEVCCHCDIGEEMRREYHGTR